MYGSKPFLLSISSKYNLTEYKSYKRLVYRALLQILSVLFPHFKDFFCLFESNENYTITNLVFALVQLTFCVHIKAKQLAMLLK